MLPEHWLNNLFNAIDSKNVDGFKAFISDDCNFCFANLPAVNGATEIGEFLRVFYGSIRSIDHRLNEWWQIEDGIICHGTVTYTRLDKSTLTVPFANIFKLRGEKIFDYRIYTDNSDLYK